ncbi:MAG: NAD(P)/FAD-dependent oxidoreductase [Nitrospirota bacterium]
MGTDRISPGAEGHVRDCIVIGAGPGGLQAAIYLGRYNRDVLLIDRGGGRTSHAHHIENVLTHRLISGDEIIRLGLEQAKSFNVQVKSGRVMKVEHDGSHFSVFAEGTAHRSRNVVVSTGVSDVFPAIEGIYRFLGEGYFTCIDCDGYRTTGRQLVVTGNSLNAVNLALAMQQLFTRDVTFIPYDMALPESSAEVLAEEGITVRTGRPVRLIGEKALEGLELADGTVVACEAVMASFGVRLNDDFLAGLPLKKDAEHVRYATSRVYESSLPGLYIVGPLTGQDQVVIAAGEGATAAIDINKRLLEEQQGSGEVCSLAEEPQHNA